MKTKYDDIKKVQKFTSPDKILPVSINEKVAFEGTVKKMKVVFRLCYQQVILDLYRNPYLIALNSFTICQNAYTQLK